MEARLAGKLEAGERRPETEKEMAEGDEAVAPVSDLRAETPNAEDAGQRPALLEGEGAPNAWPDESMEAAMVSELRGRGEQPVAKPATDAPEESDNKSLPALSELVQRLSPEVRDTLDELFRAKFVRVTRVPSKALKK